MSRPEVVLPPDPNYALRIRHSAAAGWEQWYLLTGDEHWDSPECYLRLLHRHLRQAKERDALWISNGDFFDAISSRDDKRGSKGSLREEHNRVNYLDQLVDRAVDEFAPYLDMLVYYGTGNHEQKITIQKETDIGARFTVEANRLRGDLPPIYRAGYSGFIRFMFELGTVRCSDVMYLEHGSGGGNSPVTKGVIGTARRAARVDGATWFVTSHIHEQWCLTGQKVCVNNSSSRIEQRQAAHIQLASYKRDFRTDGVATWYTMVSNSPKPIGGTWLRLYTPDGKRIRWEIIPTEVPYEDLVEYLPAKTA